jgi:hypothetical protein
MENSHLDIASADIDSIRFRASDSMTLYNGVRIAGKVCRSINDTFLIATGEGLRRISQNTVGTIIRNSGGPLTVPSLPETDNQFAPTDEGVIGDHPPGMVVRLNGNLFVPFITNEHAGYRFAYMNGQPDHQYCYGGGLGISVSEPLTIFVQYERYSTGTRPGTSSGNIGNNEATYNLIYGSLEIQLRSASHSDWSYCLAVDLGIISGSEEYHSATGVTWSVSENSFMGRPRFEIEYAFPNSSFALRSGVGYLLPAGNIVRFTGTMLNASILFRLPFIGGPI